MREPDQVADCVAAMRMAAEVPITVKCRTGVDELDDYEFLHRFVSVVADAGCGTFIVHARKAILSGLSPAQNRTIPPLDWTRVSRLKSDFPQLTFIVNGGLDNVPAACTQLRSSDGVMLGRAAYHNPWLLAELECALFGTAMPATRREVLDRFLPYVAHEIDAGARLNDIARHLHGLFNGCPGARQFRRHLSDHAHRAGAGIEVLIDAAAHVAEGNFGEAMARCSNG
jgi:tRNA-dihydrouridine synthase A